MGTTAMHVLRTPDERFAELPDYPFAPHYAEITAVPGDAASGRLRVHYVDEGRPTGHRSCSCTANPRGATCTAT